MTDHVIIKFMTLQLLFLLDASSNKCIAYEIKALVGKKPPKPSARLKRKLCVQLINKLPKFDGKTRRENRGLN